MSQSVEHDHPRTFDFLRSDIRNMNDFFARRTVGEVKTLGMRRTWDFIVSDRVNGLRREDEVGEEGERKLMAIARSWIEDDEAVGDSDADARERHTNSELGNRSLTSSTGDEAVFMSSFIPRSLADVVDPERAVDMLNSGQSDQLIYIGLAGVDQTQGAMRMRQGDKQETIEAESGEDLPQQLAKTVRFDDEEQSQDSDDAEERKMEGEISKSRPRGFRHEDKDVKKVSMKLRGTSSLTTVSGAKTGSQGGEAREKKDEVAESREAEIS